MISAEILTMRSVPKVVVVGGGFAGVLIARKLKNSFDVTLVDPKDYFIFKPLLDEYSVGTLPNELVKFDYSKILKGVRHVEGKAQAFDYENNTVKVQLTGKDGRGSQSILHYDYLAIAMGAGPNSFGIMNNIFHIYDIEHADEVMRHMCKIRDRIKEGKTVKVAVAGAGPVGMECAGVVEEFIRHYSEQYQNNNPHEVIMFNAADEILLGFSEKIKDMAKSTIESRPYMKIDNFCFCKTIEKKGEYYLLDYEKNKKMKSDNFDLVLWSAGIKKGSLKGESYDADEFLRLKNDKGSYDNVFVAGDSANINYNGSHVPELAQTAVQEARHVVKNIKLRQKRANLLPYVPHMHGTIITIGYHKELGHIGKNFVISGFPAWVLHRLVYLDQMYMLEHKIRYLYRWSQGLFNKRYSYLQCPKKNGNSKNKINSADGDSGIGGRNPAVASEKKKAKTKSLPSKRSASKKSASAKSTAKNSVSKKSNSKSKTNAGKNASKKKKSGSSKPAKKTAPGSAKNSVSTKSSKKTSAKKKSSASKGNTKKRANETVKKTGKKTGKAGKKSNARKNPSKKKQP